MNTTKQTYIDGSKAAQKRRERLDNARMTGFSNAPDEQTGEGNAPREVIVSAYNHDQGAKNVQFVRIEGEDAERTAWLLKECGYKVSIYSKIPTKTQRKDRAKNHARKELLKASKYASALIGHEDAKLDAAIAKAEGV